MLGPVQITTLGGLAVDGRPVRGDRLAAVLRELVEARGRAVSVGALVEAVWDGEPPQDEAGAIQALVSRLRRTGLPVVGAPGGYRLPTENLHVDATDVRDRVTRATTALRDGRPAVAQQLADEARALFPDVPDLDDVAIARLFSEVAMLRAEAALAGAGALDGTDLHRLVDRTPPDEPAVALLVRVLAAQGRDAEALELVEQVRTELADRYGADPSPVVVEAHLALLRGELPTTRPTPRTDVHQTVHLPPSWRRASTPLLGRDVDLAAVLAALDTAPLVTLVATGGAGKTRLAAEVARCAAADGRSVQVVELAGLRSPDEVLPAVLATIGGGDTTPSRADLTVERRVLEPAERLRQAAQDLDGLLVLDNCEHLLDAAAAVVADLLDSASPDVVVLATSRAPLGIVGEAVHQLRMLPDEDALGLLEARTRAGRPGVTWDRELALQLCHRLDNLPLALELAAARLRSMPVEDVLDGLSDRFALLDDALRGLPERHASLWAMVDWSRELLAPAERALLARLAVVAGSFTAETAMSVADQPAPAVRRGLSILVEQSLLTMADQDEGPARYRMLETVREYGEARLDAAGDRPAAMAGLVRWAAARAVRLGADFVGPAQVAAFEACARDQEALLVAARWAADHDDEPALVDIIAALFWLWTVRGAHMEVVGWATRILHVDDPAARRTSPLLHGRASGRALPNADRAGIVGTLAAMNGGVIESLRLSVIAWRACRCVRDERGDQMSARTLALSGALPALGFNAEDLGPPAAALVGSDDPYLQALGLFMRAAVAENLGDTEESGQAAREAYDRFKAAGDHWGMGMAAQGIGQWGSGRGTDDALVWLERGVRHLEIVGAMQDARSIRLLLDVQRAIAGQEDALVRVEQTARSEQADDTDVAQARLGLAQIAWSDGRLADASRYADSAIDVALSGVVRVPQAHVVFMVAAATIHVRAAEEGDAAGRAAAEARATDLLRRATAEAKGISDMPVLGSFALGCAELAASRDEVAVAVELFALGTRLGANMGSMFQLGTGGRLEALVGDDAARAAAVAPLRDEKSSTIAARVQTLATELLE
ncbi:putative ATPase [Cellulomonas sp. PhB150]|nr:putative ATPase [Cellulomonas sp. PhB150]